MTWKLDSRRRGEQHIVEAKEEGTSVAYIVIDSTVNGRSRGGLRIVPDLSEVELSVAARAMTLKYGLLGLPQGGAKAGILGNGEASPEDRQRLL
ncbi:MAG: Glu/Leu/Phe/Val dehydrogenase dimerization domain-containing protein, partial [Thermoanaerobaculia bacterium]